MITSLLSKYGLRCMVLLLLTVGTVSLWSLHETQLDLLFMTLPLIGGTFVPPLQGKIDVPLSNYAREHLNAAFIADILAPRVPVGKQSDKFWLMGRESQQDPGDELRAAGAAAIELKQALSTDSYFADDHSGARLITDEERDGFEAGNVEEWATRMVMDRIVGLKREVRLKDIVTNSANYAASNRVTLAGANQWSDEAASNPIGDVETAKKQVGLTGTPANLIVIGPDSFQALKVNQKIIDRVANVKAGAVTREDLEAIFELPIVVARGVIRSAAGVQSYIWPDSAWVGVAQQTPSTMDLSFIKSFVWVTAPGTAQGFQVEVTRLNPGSRKADELAVHFYYDHKLTATDAGYLIIDTNA